jgi:hypothetical protein
MGEVLDKLLWLIVGACVTYVLQRLLAARNEKRPKIRTYRFSFRGFPNSHKALFFPGLTEELWEAKIPPRLRDHCITVVVFIESVGNGVAKDVRLTVDAKNNSGIAAHTFLVDKAVICERLETKKVEDKRLVATQGERTMNR